MDSLFFQGKSVLITGVCGTVGVELFRQVLSQSPGEVIGLDNNESELFLLSDLYSSVSNAHFYLCDQRDSNQLMHRTRGVDVILHAAALKHVIICERSPQDAIQTNILGTEHLIHAAIENNVSHVLLTSSDKAVNPTNVMGASKLMAERLMTAANASRKSNGPIFASTRFGNVLGSRGSVIPLFKRQIRRGGPVTLTSPEMTRFIMTLEEAVRLVMNSVHLARGGEVFVTKMRAIRIEDLAQIMVEEIAPRSGHSPRDVSIQIIGAKAGEKFYEELMNDEETRRTLELEDYFVVLPAFRRVYGDIDYSYPGASAAGIDHPYNSALEEPLTREELRAFLKDNNLLEVDETSCGY